MLPFEIKGFPMPPSANVLYANSPQGGRFKTAKYKQYETQAQIWIYKNGHQLITAQEQIKSLKHGEVLSVERDFYFRSDRIISSKGTPLKNDTSNRIKALDDILSKMLGIDDSYFWDGKFKKNPSPHISLGEYVDIRFKAIKIRNHTTDQDA